MAGQEKKTEAYQAPRPEKRFTQPPFSQRSKAAFRLADNKAGEYGYSSMGRKLLLLGLVMQGDIIGVLKEFSNKPASVIHTELEAELKEDSRKRRTESEKTLLSRIVQERIFPRAEREARSSQAIEISPSHLLIALIDTEKDERVNDAYYGRYPESTILENSGLIFDRLNEIREYLKKQN